MLNSKSESYAKSGVDITAGYESVERIKPHIKSTHRAGVLGAFGGFGGFFEPDLRAMKRPVLVTGTDGVGTKLKIAMLMDKHDTIGIDCVAMCVNDIVCCGAEPVIFLDYLAMGKNIPARTERIVAGVADGCRQAGCALVGGESAEHPGMMPEEDYDIAGFSAGFVDHDAIIDGRAVKPGDAVIGLASSGLHSNGFSLVRRVFQDELASFDKHCLDLGCTLGEELLRPTTIYVKPLLHVIRQFGADMHGISNITGGGFYENVPRMLPDGIRASIDALRFPKMPIFDMLAKKGKIPAQDMYNTFNMGIGMCIAVSEDKAQAVMAEFRAQGIASVHIGHCESGERGIDLTW